MAIFHSTSKKELTIIIVGQFSAGKVGQFLVGINNRYPK
jgi:hypothetical protein